MKPRKVDIKWIVKAFTTIIAVIFIVATQIRPEINGFHESTKELKSAIENEMDDPEPGPNNPRQTKIKHTEGIKTNDLESLSYKGDAYIRVDDSVPRFSNELIEKAKTDPKSVTSYEMDSLGRPTGATFVVSKNTLNKKERGDISGIYPPGWDQEKYDEKIVNGGYIYNRCHLIAHCLGGIDDKSNLITGTRYLNIEGMWQLEETVKYAAEDGADILYRVTPVYNKTELLCRGVLMEAYSLNDEGKSVKFCIYCFNAQPYIGINYSNGDTWLIEK